MSWIKDEWGATVTNEVAENLLFFSVGVSGGTPPFFFSLRQGFFVALAVLELYLASAF